MKSARTVLLHCFDDQVLSGFRALLERHEYLVKHVISCDHALETVHSLLDNGRVVEAIIAVGGSETEIVFFGLHKAYPQLARMLLIDANNAAAAGSFVNDYLVDKLLLLPISDDAILYSLNSLVQQRKTFYQNIQYGKEVKRLKQELTTANSNLESRIKQKAEDLVKVIYYDELTGLASRALLKDRIDHAISLARRADNKIALFIVGLDRFKNVNDIFGQEAGDTILIEISERISRCVRSCDTVSRFGGDVFSLLTTDPDRVEDPSFVAKRILDSISVPCRFGNQEIFLTSSIGISIFPEDGESANDLLANAETAMRQAKQGDRNQLLYYSGEFNQLAGKRLTMEAELRKAITNEEFELYYQPRVDVQIGRVVGAEALLRWHHPERGIVSPMEFLPILEESGLIEPVGEWVLDQALHALQRWKNKSMPTIMLAVNLSARQFHDNKLPQLVSDLAKATGVGLGENNLELEITETLLMKDVVATREMLLRLHDMGIKIAIDDFGTGYSALSYLIKFPLNYLKIDKSFVDRIHVSNDAKAIVEAIVSLSNALRLTVIGEGVETKEQLNVLISLGCRQFQGYLFAKPMPEEDFVQIMLEDSGVSIVSSMLDDNLFGDTVLKSNHHNSSQTKH